MKQPNRNALALLALMGFGFFVLVLWYGQQYLQTGVVRIERIEKVEKIAAAAALAPTNPTAAAELVAAAEAPAPAIEPTEVVTGAAATIGTASTEGEAAVEPSAATTETVETGTAMTETTPLASPLAGTAWALVRLNDAEILPDTEITAEFLPDGSMTGTGSCNDFTATFATDGDQITISTPESKVMGGSCQLTVEEQESAYLVGLEAAATFELNEDKLTVMNAQGDKILEYKAAQIQ
jgi:heat shock protein HslJ